MSGCMKKVLFLLLVVFLTVPSSVSFAGDKMLDLEALSVWNLKLMKKFADGDKYEDQYYLYKLARKNKDRDEKFHWWRLLLSGAGISSFDYQVKIPDPMAEYLVGLIFINYLDDAKKGEALLSKAYDRAVELNKRGADNHYTLEKMYFNALVHPELARPKQMKEVPEVEEVYNLLMKKSDGHPIILAMLGALGSNGFLSEEQILSFMKPMVEVGKLYPATMVAMASLIENVEGLKELHDKGYHIIIYQKAAELENAYAINRLAELNK